MDEAREQPEGVTVREWLVGFRAETRDAEMNRRQLLLEDEGEDPQQISWDENELTNTQLTTNSIASEQYPNFPLPHTCGAACDCKIELEAALAALCESSSLLSSSVSSGCNEQIGRCSAVFRMTKSRLFDALDCFKAHLTRPPSKTA